MGLRPLARRITDSAAISACRDRMVPFNLDTLKVRWLYQRSLTPTMSAGLQAKPEQRGFCRRFDLAALAAFLVGYLCLNVAVAIAASL